MIVSRFWIVTADVEDIRFVFLLNDNGDLIEQNRTVADIEVSATDKGHELSYCPFYQDYFGKMTRETLRQKVMNWICFRHGLKRPRDVEVEVKSIIRVLSDE